MIKNYIRNLAFAVSTLFSCGEADPCISTNNSTIPINRSIDGHTASYNGNYCEQFSVVNNQPMSARLCCIEPGFDNKKLDFRKYILEVTGERYLPLHGEKVVAEGFQGSYVDVLAIKARKEIELNVPCR